MRTRRSPRVVVRRAAPAVALTLTLTALGLTAGCSALDAAEEPDPTAGAPSATALPLLEDREALDRAVRTLLRERAAALEGADAPAVVDAVVADREVRRGQRRYVRNLSRLPVRTLRYRTGDARVAVAEGGEVRVDVDLLLRLDDLDTAPVAQPREMVLTTEGAEGAEGLRLASDAPTLTDPSAGGAQPWDTGGIVTLDRAGVLGVFDGRGVASADGLVEAAADAADVVGDVLPYEWSREVVVYAPSDTVLLQALAGLPGGVADRLDGVAFPVRSAGGGPVVAERVVLHPRMLTADELERGRLLRHELVHVALGARDDLVPRWLAEGVAEWVSVRPLPLGERLISSAALEVAREGLDDLPADATFNSGPASGANYGIAWQVCEEIVDTYGEEALWNLLDAMGDRGDRTPEDVLAEVLGTSGPALVDEAADRILSAYG